VGGRFGLGLGAYSKALFWILYGKRSPKALVTTLNQELVLEGGVAGEAT